MNRIVTFIKKINDYKKKKEIEEDKKKLSKYKNNRSFVQCEDEHKRVNISNFQICTLFKEV